MRPIGNLLYPSWDYELPNDCLLALNPQRVPNTAFVLSHFIPQNIQFQLNHHAGVLRINNSGDQPIFWNQQDSAESPTQVSSRAILPGNLLRIWAKIDANLQFLTFQGYNSKKTDNRNLYPVTVRVQITLDGTNTDEKISIKYY